MKSAGNDYLNGVVLSCVALVPFSLPGFNASVMGDAPWTLVVDGKGGVSERRLGDHEARESCSMLQII